MEEAFKSGRQLSDEERKRLTLGEPNKCSYRHNWPWDGESIQMSADNICPEHMLEILEKYPDHDWDWKKVTEKLFTCNNEDVIMNLELPLDMHVLSENISFVTISKHLNRDWNKKAITDRIGDNYPTYPKMVNLLFDLREFILWDKMNVSKRYMIQTKHTLPWDWGNFTPDCNCGAKECPITPIEDLLDIKGLDWKLLSGYYSVYTAIQYPDKNWDWSQFKEVAPWVIKKYPEKKWNMTGISHNAQWDTIMDFPDGPHPQHPWDLEHIASTGDLPPSYFLERYGKFYDLKDITKRICPSYLIEYIRVLPWEYVLEKKDVPFQLVLMYPTKEWKKENVYEQDAKVDAFFKLKDKMPFELVRMVINKL
jgi:hypothetical protein